MKYFNILNCIVGSLLYTISISAQCPIGQEIMPVTLEIDLSGRNSMDLQGDPSNDVFTVCDAMAADATFNLIGWTLITATSTAPSLCSELQISVSGGGSYDFIPGAIDFISGPCSPYGTIHLLDISANNIRADAAGCVTIELSETLDNFPDAADAMYSGGTITLQGERCIDIVPTLGEWAIIILSLSMIIIGVVAMSQKEVGLA